MKENQLFDVRVIYQTSKMFRKTGRVAVGVDPSEEKAHAMTKQI